MAAGGEKRSGGQLEERQPLAGWGSRRRCANLGRGRELVEGEIGMDDWRAGGSVAGAGGRPRRCSDHSLNPTLTPGKFSCIARSTKEPRQVSFGDVGALAMQLQIGGRLDSTVAITSRVTLFVSALLHMCVNEQREGEILNVLGEEYPRLSLCILHECIHSHTMFI